MKGLINELQFIEIFEFSLSGDLIKYSYTLVKEGKSILRYDNAPHHEEFTTYPHHKHLKEKIQELNTPDLKNFVKEIMSLSFSD